MDVRTTSSSRHREKPPIRLFALLALLVAGCLLVWRGMLLLAPPEPAWQASNPNESQLMGILAPIAGAENIRLTVSQSAEGARTVVVLLASDIDYLASDITRVATRSIGLDEAAGEVLVIETAAFATPTLLSSTPADMMEMFALAIICIALAWIAYATGAGQAQGQVRTSSPEPEPKPDYVPDIRRERGAGQPALMPDTEAVARVARRDPAQAAKIIRSWMRQSGGEG